MLYHGKITTLDASQPKDSALAVTDGKIFAIGSDDELLALAGPRVASYHPWNCMWWMVTSKTVGGTIMHAESDRLPREVALRLYTHGSAWFSHEDHLKGTLAVGRIVFSNPFALGVEQCFWQAISTPQHLQSGRGGIRTPGWFPIAGFQDRCIRPLCHPTEAYQDK